MVAASFSTLSGLHYPSSRFLQTPLGLLVMEQFCSVTVSQAHGFQHSLSVNRVQGTFPYHRGSYLWGPLWASKRVNFLSDSRSLVEILRSGTSRAPTIMSLVRYLSLLVARHSFSFTSSPLEGSLTRSPTHCLAFSFSVFSG